jgi:cysteine desulfurase
VLEAMGVLSHGNVRISLPWRITAEEVDRFLADLPAVVTRVRSEAPSAPPQMQAPERAREAAPESAAGEAIETIDALGLMCPIPVIELAKRIGDVPVGGTVRVLADDPAARLDIPAWSELREHSYLGEEPVPERGERAVAYLVRREH